MPEPAAPFASGAGAAAHRTYAKSSIRRRRILEVATELFSVSGYAATSLSAVARGVGISDAGLLYYFPSKEALLHAALETIPLPSPRCVTAADPHETIASLLGDADPLVAAIGLEARSPTHPGHAFVLSYYDALKCSLEMAFCYAEQGEMLRRPARPHEVALLAVVFVQGIRASPVAGSADERKRLTDLFINSWLSATRAPAKCFPGK